MNTVMPVWLKKAFSSVLFLETTKTASKTSGGIFTPLYARVVV
jgi:hypothetical protein